MKIIRFLDPENNVHYGLPGPDDRAQRLEGNLFSGLHPTGEHLPVSKLLAPLVPTQLICIGMNYRKHAEETGGKVPEYPVVFMKSLNALQHPGDPIELPRHLRSDEVDYEVELAVVIGKDTKNIPVKRALESVLGYTCANDVSARDWQLRRSGRQWCRAKSFDTFCPLGPCLVTPDDLPDPQTLQLSTRVGGETLQDCNTRDMIFSVAEIIAFLSASTTLLAGSVILTGTPHGVGMGREPKRWLHPGETVEVSIDSIGTLSNPVIEEPLSATERVNHNHKRNKKNS